MKLDMGQVAAEAVERLHRGQRRPPVARQAELVAVNVDWMWQSQLVCAASDRGNDLARSNIETVDLRLQAHLLGHRLPLPLLHAARIHQLRRIAAPRAE